MPTMTSIRKQDYVRDGEDYTARIRLYKGRYHFESGYRAFYDRNFASLESAIRAMSDYLEDHDETGGRY